MKDLYLNEEEFNRIVAKRRAKNAVVIIHPYFDAMELKGRYAHILASLIERAKAPVVFILDANSKRYIKEKRLRFPAHFFFASGRERSASLDGENFAKLSLIFQNAGVKTVLIGGMYACAEPYHGKSARLQVYPRVPLTAITDGCVAVAHEKLRRAAKSNYRLRLVPNLLAPDSITYSEKPSTAPRK